ncbi:hypothetical protein E2320_001792, partial [Naja naja]
MIEFPEENMGETITQTTTAKIMKKAFLEALQSNDYRTLEELLAQKQIDVDTVFEVEDENLLLASYKQGYWLPSYKLQHSWATGLHLSVLYGHLESLSVLLKHKATINCRPNGKAAIHIACEVANLDCINILCSHGAKTNCYSLSGLAPLHYCTTKFSMPCAQQLIWKGADVNIRSNNQDEETPLHTVARCGIPEMVAFYVEQGAVVDDANAHRETPLSCAVYWALNGKEQIYSTDHHLICRMLLDYKADVNSRDEDFRTPLHKAAWNCDHVLLNMLLEAGAEANLMDDNGCAPLQYVLKVTDTYRSFYESLFEACANTPRSLKHLARCAIRRILLHKCHKGIPLLLIPAILKRQIITQHADYSLTPPEGHLLRIVALSTHCNQGLFLFLM